MKANYNKRYSDKDIAELLSLFSKPKSNDRISMKAVFKCPVCGVEEEIESIVVAFIPSYFSDWEEDDFWRTAKENPELFKEELVQKSKIPCMCQCKSMSHLYKVFDYKIITEKI